MYEYVGLVASTHLKKYAHQLQYMVGNWKEMKPPTKQWLTSTHQCLSVWMWIHFGTVWHKLVIMRTPTLISTRCQERSGFSHGNIPGMNKGPPYLLEVPGKRDEQIVALDKSRYAVRRGTGDHRTMKLTSAPPHNSWSYLVSYMVYHIKYVILLGSLSYPHKPLQKCGKDKNESNEPDMVTLSLWTNDHYHMYYNDEWWNLGNKTNQLIIVTSSAVLSCIIHVPLCSSKPRYGETTALQGVAEEVHMWVSVCPLVEDVEVSCYLFACDP
jgi:hypothetical protein